MAITLIRNKCHQDLPDPIAIGLEGIYQTLLVELQKSSTAQQIVKFVDGNTKEVGLLLIADGSDSSHIVNSETSAFSGGIAVVNINNPMSIAGYTLPLGISLIHELGHAKQYMEKPDWYKTMFDNIVKQKKWAGAGKYDKKKTAFAEDHPDVKALIMQSKAPRPRGQASPVSAGQIQAARKAAAEAFDFRYNGAMQALEMDNITTHEHPVVREFGFPEDCCRKSYP